MQITANKVSAAFMILVALVLVWFKWPEPTQHHRPMKQVELPKPEQPKAPETPEAPPAEMALSAISLPPPPPLDVSTPEPAAPVTKQEQPIAEPSQAKPVQMRKPVKQVKAIKRISEAKKPVKSVAIKPLKKSVSAQKAAPKPIRPIDPKPVNQLKQAKVDPAPIRPLKKTERPKKSESKTEIKPKIRPLRKSQPTKSVEKPQVPEITEPDGSTPEYAQTDQPQTESTARQAFAENANSLPKTTDLEQDWRQKADQMVTVSARSSTRTVQEGRTLLRLLEHGSGPGISLTWPSGNPAQQRLFDVFNRCYGMVTAVMDSSGMLYIDQGRRGSPWQVSMDAYSGFVRQPTGSSIQKEAQRADRIRNYHGLRGQNGLVRVFPRSVDAVILGGLSRLIGRSYKTAGRINARYEMNNGRLEVRDVRVDGKLIPGVISVEPYQSCGGLA